MAEKQNNDFMVNAQDNAEPVPTSAPVEFQEKPVQLPVGVATPVIMKPAQVPYSGPVDPIYFVTPDVALEHHRRQRACQVNVLLFATCMFAVFAFLNGLTFLRTDFKKELGTTDITFVALKTAVGLTGAIVLATRKFFAIKPYAVAFLLVYACHLGYFLYDVFMHGDEHSERVCGEKKFVLFADETYADCVARRERALLWKGFLAALYASTGFAVTWTYATKVRTFVKTEAAHQKREQADTDLC